MLPLIIKIKTGYSIDYNYHCDEPCPNCGGKVYHIQEDDHTVFCTSIGCAWHDKTIYPKGFSFAEMQKRVVRESFERAFEPGGCFHLKYNEKYSNCSHPVIIMPDACDYKCIIRDFDFNSGYGYWDGSYSKPTIPIVEYATMDEMIEDGWRPD